ncbi:MAG: hypothetical protein HOO92_03600 [Methylococcaceae bacterium]|nr:hypothetical protein [Methylococcaceae bacterium]
MHALTERELYEALTYAKSIDRDAGAYILEQFHQEQSAFATTIFGIFPNVLAEQDIELSYLFMDLVFDVLCVFQNIFGPLPDQSDIDADWLDKQAFLLDAELQSLMTNRDMEPKIRNKLQTRFVQRAKEDNPQIGLINYMNAAVDQFAIESSHSLEALQTTKALISVVIRLFGNLYSHTGNA